MSIFWVLNREEMPKKIVCKSCRIVDKFPFFFENMSALNLPGSHKTGRLPGAQDLSFCCELNSAAARRINLCDK